MYCRNQQLVSSSGRQRSRSAHFQGRAPQSCRMLHGIRYCVVLCKGFPWPLQGKDHFAQCDESHLRYEYAGRYRATSRPDPPYHSFPFSLFRITTFLGLRVMCVGLFLVYPLLHKVSKKSPGSLEMLFLFDSAFTVSSIYYFPFYWLAFYWFCLLDLIARIIKSTENLDRTHQQPIS